MLSANALYTTEEFNSYSNNYDETLVPLKTMCIEAASQIVRDYLGYDPVLHTSTEWYDGTGLNSLVLNSFPAMSVEAMEVNGVPVDVSAFVCDGWMLLTGSYVIPRGRWNVKLSYTAGHEAGSVPALFRVTCARIAGVLLSESGGNVGISAKSFEDGSRTYLRDRFDRFLEPLESYRRVL